MALPPIVAPLITQVDTVVTGFFLTASSSMAAAAVTPFKTLVTVYILMWGLAMWRGLIDEPLSDAVGRIFRVVLIGAIALGSGYYGPYIATLLYNTPAQLASVLVPAASPSTVMDGALSQGNDIAAAFWAAGGITNLGPIFEALIVWIFTILVVLYATALILLSKVALGVVIAFGPLFIAFLLFDTTKNFFTSWLGQALNYLFIYSLAVAVIQIMFSLWATQLAGVPLSGTSFTDLIAALIVGGACFVVLMQVTGIASALAGGVQIGTLGAVGWTANKLGRGAGAARRGTLRREEFRRADGSRGAEWRGAAPAAARGAAALARNIKDRVTGGNSVAAK